MYLNNYSSLWLICGASLKGISMTSCVCNDMRILCATLHSVSRTHRETKSRKKKSKKDSCMKEPPPQPPHPFFTWPFGYSPSPFWKLCKLFGGWRRWWQQESESSMESLTFFFFFPPQKSALWRLLRATEHNVVSTKLELWPSFDQARPDCCSWLLVITCSLRLRPSQKPHRHTRMHRTGGRGVCASRPF